jgi:hypothetical protein
VNVARKGWLEPEDVLNAMTVNEISAFLEQRKKRAQEILRRQKR